MEKFKEKKIVEIFNLIIVIIGITFLFCLIIPLLVFLLSIVWHKLYDAGMYIFTFGILLLPISIPFIIISFAFSDKKEYTSQFLQYMRNNLKSAITLKELLELEQEFKYLAIEENSYCLSYPISLREIHREILNKIDILEKQPKKVAE